MRGNNSFWMGIGLLATFLHTALAQSSSTASNSNSAGAEFVFVSDEYYKGDESNQNAPLPGYHVWNLHSTLHVTEKFEVFGSIQNLLNERYATFGIYSDPTGINAPGVPPEGVSNGPGVDNRFQSPAMPFGAFVGARLRF